MNWLNEPPAWSLTGDVLRVTSAPTTDFWRNTHYGFIRDSGHLYYRQMPGDLVAEVKVSGAYASLYDQAGLMVRLNNSHWMKCGIEFVDGVQHASVVVTHDFSDWSVVPVPSNPASVWLRVTRRKEAIAVHYSLDGQQYTMLRMAYLMPAEAAMVGPMCASPEGTGFSATFEALVIRGL